MRKVLKNNKRVFIYILAGVIILFILLFITVSAVVGSDVKKLCLEAKRNYDGEYIEALISLLNDESRDFRERNSAIWALGQLGDNQALPVLQSLYTGKIPPREPYDKGISQYELKKAINLTSGGFNATAIFWRYSID